MAIEFYREFGELGYLANYSNYGFYKNGIDLDELRDILGHSDINTTAIYTMTSNREKREKLERIRY